MKNTRKIQKQYGRAAFTPSSINVEEREVDVVFATENPVPRFGWSEDYDEVLSCKPSNVRMERVNRGLPVMDCHNTFSVFAQLGRSTKVWFEDGKMCARLKFSENPKVQEVFRDIQAGIVCDISVGYRVFKFEREDRGNGKTPIYRAIDWQPQEISFAPVQADYLSEVRSESGENEVQIFNSNIHQKRKVMKITCPECGHEFEAEKADSYTCPECGAEFTEEQRNAKPTATRAAAPQPQPAKPVDVEAIRKEATQAQNERLNAILLSTRAAKLPDNYAIELYQSDKSLEQCRQAIIEKFVAAEPAKPNGGHDMRVGVEAVEKKRNAMQNAILHRASPQAFKLEDGAREFRGMTLIEMGKELLHERGVSVRGLSRAQVADLIFGRAHSTSDFPILFESALDKMLRGDYDFAPEYWQQIARQTSVNDFRERGLYQAETKNGMHETPEGGEIKYTTMVEGKQKIRVKKYAEGIKFTREAFINDDLGALALVPDRFVRDWDEKRGDLVWGLILDNVKMGDGKDLFCAGHNNVASGAGSVLGEAGLTAAQLLFKKQTGLDGKRRIRVQPRTIVVPAELEVQAQKLLTAIAASTTKDVNVFANKYNVIVEPRLTEPEAWYLTADPNAIDGLYYAYLDGEAGLRVHNEDNFDTDSMKYAVRGEFGTQAVDYRGWVKMAGK